MPTSSSRRIHSHPTNCVDVLADVASSAQRIDTPTHRSPTHFTSEIIAARDELHLRLIEAAMLSIEVVSPYRPTPLHPQQLRNTIQPCKTDYTCSRSPELSRARVLPSYEIAPEDNNHTLIGDDETCRTPTFQSSYAVASPSMDRHRTMRPLLGQMSDHVSSDTQRANSAAFDMVENGLSGRREDENTSHQEKGSERTNFDLKFQPEDVFKADSSSESNVSDNRGKMDIHDYTGDTTESNRSLAKDFLERTRGRLYDYREEENVGWDGQLELSLQEMAEY